MNEDIVVIRRLVATSLSATWHLETPLALMWPALLSLVTCRCHVILVVVVVHVGGRKRVDDGGGDRGWW